MNVDQVIQGEGARLFVKKNFFDERVAFEVKLVEVAPSSLSGLVPRQNAG
jgi:hypothetical protein